MKNKLWETNKKTCVVVSNCFGIAKGLKNWVGL